MSFQYVNSANIVIIPTRKYGRQSMNMNSPLLVASLLLIAGQAFAGSLDVVVPSSVSPGVKETIQPSWPKVLKACPGLQRFADDLSFVGVEDNLAYAPAAAKRIDVIFRVAEQPKKVPPAFRASGHVCYFGISPNGTKLHISKSPCASICTGAESTSSDEFVKAM